MQSEAAVVADEELCRHGGNVCRELFVRLCLPGKKPRTAFDLLTTCW